MSDGATLLKQARDLFQQGQSDKAEEIVGLLLRDNPRDTVALNFRAYLLYRRGNLEDALAAYRRLTELEPQVAGHFANLGLLSFKGQRLPEARAAFERQLELQPDDQKALRNLGFCHERLQQPENALDCFTRAGDEENAQRLRAQLAHHGAGSGAAGAGAPARAASASAGPRLGGGPQPAAEPGVADWLDRLSLPAPGDGAGLLRAGPGELLAAVREKVFVNPAYCIGHRGVVVFAPAFREAEKAASKFGERHGILARAEGNGELVLSGLGRGLQSLRLGGGRLFVNWGSLVLCGTDVSVAFDLAGLMKDLFLPAELSGRGHLVLAVRGAPVVLPVGPEAPTLARPESVVAWTEGLSFEQETVPELRKLLGKQEAVRLRFEGRGHLVLQSC
jgi:uncharacterized protein (AIM24 family)